MGTSGNKIDTDLVAGNIKDGVDIYGVEGSFEGGNPSVLSNIIGNMSPMLGVKLFENSGQIHLLYGINHITYETVDDIYMVSFYTFVNDKTTNDDYTNIISIVYISKLDKGTGEISYISSDPVNHGSYSGSSSDYSDRLQYILDDSGTLKFTIRLRVDSTRSFRHFEFDTSTDTFTYNGTTTEPTGDGVPSIGTLNTGRSFSWASDYMSSISDWKLGFTNSTEPSGSSYSTGTITYNGNIYGATNMTYCDINNGDRTFLSSISFATKTSV